MKTHKVSGPRFLDPLWFNKVKHGRHSGTVKSGGVVNLEGVLLQIVGDPPAAGKTVEVWLNHEGFFVCATTEEIDKAEYARTKVRAREELDRQEVINALRLEAENFNAQLALPVRWGVAIKDVLSGLSEGSNGDGRSKATVEHVLLFEPLRAGRLLRAKGDFLCSTSSRENGMKWSGRRMEVCPEANTGMHQPKVTCKACLKIAQRWMKD